MATNFDSPNYPVISWQSRLSGTLTVENLDTSNTLVIDFADGSFDDKWGFASTTGEVATSDSIHGYLAQLIQAFLVGDGSPSAVVTATYQFSAEGTILVQFAYTGGLDDVTLTFSTTDLAAEFGFNTTTATIPTGDSETTNHNSCCYWEPYNLTLYDDRATIAPQAFVVSSLDGTQYKTRRWSSERVRRSLTFPDVRQTYLWSWRREDPGFAGPPGPGTTDPNNLLEDLLSAARRNNDNADSTQFRIYNEVAKYRLGVWSNQELLRDFDTINDQTNGAQIYLQVVLPFEDLGDDGSGGI
jgi:hypothetical protein